MTKSVRGQLPDSSDNHQSGQFRIDFGDGSRGFTLIELIVVLALISVLLAFAVPRFQDVFIDDPIKKPTRWLMVKVPLLRYQAIRDQQIYTLHVGLSENCLWTSNESRNREEAEKARQKAFKLSEKVRLTGVVFANGKRQTVDVAEIRFHPQGWAEQAIIQMETADRRHRFSFLIRPFLALPEPKEGYKGFENR